MKIAKTSKTTKLSFKQGRILVSNYKNVAHIVTHFVTLVQQLATKKNTRIKK